VFVCLFESKRCRHRERLPDRGVLAHCPDVRFAAFPTVPGAQAMPCNACTVTSTLQDARKFCLAAESVFLTLVPVDQAAIRREVSARPGSRERIPANRKLPLRIRVPRCSDESLSTFVLNPEISASRCDLVIRRKYPEPIDASNGRLDSSYGRIQRGEKTFSRTQEQRYCRGTRDHRCRTRPNDDRRMRRNGARIDQGVCITSHASQCHTLDQVVVLP
jgi:hypothetical protein